MTDHHVADDEFSMIGAIEDLVERATNPLLLGADMTLNLTIIDRVTRNADEELGPCCDAIADRIDTDDPPCVILALELLDMIMKNVPASYSLIGNADYLEVLTDLIDTDSPSLEEARLRALNFIQFYGTKFSRDKNTHFAWLLNDLRKNGVKFPSATSNDPWQPVGVIPLSASGAVGNQVIDIERAPLNASNLYYKIQQLRNTQALMQEQLTALARDPTKANALLDEELAPQCRELHSQFVNFLQNDASGLQEKVFAELLQWNDALASTLSRYDQLNATRKVRVTASNLPVSATQHSKPSEIDPFSALATRQRPANTSSNSVVTPVVPSVGSASSAPTSLI